MTYTGFLIRRAQQAHAAIWQREVSSTTSTVQFGVLSVLAAQPGANQRTLCAELGLDRSTIADLISRLQKHGLVERRRADTDRRRDVLRLSPRGQDELERLRPGVDRVEALLTAALPVDDRDELHRLLRAVLTAAPSSVPASEQGVTS